MSSGALGGASHRMPNQANGYSWKYHLRCASGIWKRQWLREHRSQQAAHWNLLTDLRREHLAYAA